VAKISEPGLIFFILTKNHGYTLEALFDAVARLGTLDDPEHYKAVLRGAIPLDRDDEGLEAVEVGIDLATIYPHFDRMIGEYEIRRAKEYFADWCC
jgi:hypothetical protein